MKIAVVLSVACLTFSVTLAQAQDRAQAPTIVALASRPKPQTKAVQLSYNIKNFSEDDSSPVTLSSANCFLADHMGRVWLGAYAFALTSYDGRAFTHFGLSDGIPSITINALYEASNGDIWMGTLGGGVGIFDGAQFKTLSTKNGLINDNVESILEDKKGRMWLGTEAGASVYYRGSFRSFTDVQGLPSGTITTILEDKSGHIWFGSDKGGLAVYDGKKIKTFTTQDGLTSNTILSSMMSQDGTLWFGTKNGVTVYKQNQLSSFAHNKDLQGKSISALFQDSLDRLWFGSENGATFWDGTSFTLLSKAQGLAANDVNAIGEDRNGGIWILTDSGGPSRFDGTWISWIGSSPDFKGTVKALAEDRDGSLWIGHLNDGGLQQFDGHTLTTFTTQQGLVNNSVRSLIFDRTHSLWIATLDGVSKWDGKTFTNYTMHQGLVHNRVFDVLQDKQGQMWFATLGGVSRFDGKTFTNYTTERGLADDKSNALFEDSKGRIWVFHWYSSRVSRFDGKQFAPVQGLESANAGFEDSAGNIWFSTLQGLVRYDGQSYLRFSKKDGLVDEFIQTTIRLVREHQQPALLVGSHGVSVLESFTPIGSGKKLGAENELSNETLKKSYVPVFKNYDLESGYLIKDVSGIKSLLQDHKGVIWIGTDYLKAQLVRLDLAGIKPASRQPVAYLESVRIDNQKVPWHALSADGAGQQWSDIKFSGVEKYFPVPKNLVLPYRHNSVAFSFISINTTRPSNLLYQYKLEGLNKEWVPPTANTYAAFDSLYEGNYQFKVKARSPDGAWGEPAVFAFEILPPWYRTWWAYALYGTTALLLLFGIYYWRTAALRKRHKLLTMLYAAAERFVPKAFLSLLGKHNIQDVKLGDSIETNVTVLFSDIRGYTTLAERLKPSESYAFINSYWAHTAPIIDEHKGFISQYLGDGVMALFPQHPDDAVEAVLDMMEALERFNAKQARIGGHQILVGYALSTGPAMLGTIGVTKRMDANVISNTSNLASRVESFNKFYGTRFLVSDHTYKALSEPDKYTTRFVDKIRAKGMHNTVKLWEIYPRGPISDTERNFIETYQQAFEKYDLGDFAGALEGFRRAHEIKPEDRSCTILIDRCEVLQQGAPPGWDGVFEMQHK